MASITILQDVETRLILHIKKTISDIQDFANDNSNKFLQFTVDSIEYLESEIKNELLPMNVDKRINIKKDRKEIVEKR